MNTANTHSLENFLQDFSAQQRLIRAELGRVIIGQDDVVQQILAAIFTNGHCLIEGVPGLAKTLMVSTLARILDLQFRRIQFTPDLMPSDITGTDVLEEDENGHRNFRFVEGPLFTNILLADEINRAPPKTQSAMLQAMQEREVTMGRTTYPLPTPFFALATQNPVEQEGTYPLPEAQLDRFMFNIIIDYPTMDEEVQILTQSTHSEKPEIQKLLSIRAIQNIQKVVSSVAVSPYVIEYVARLARATRPKDTNAPEFIREILDWGAGPRAGQFLLAAGKAFAVMDGRCNVAIEDIQRAAIPVLRHRISPNFQAQAEGLTRDDIVRRLLQEVPKPKIPKYEAPTPRPPKISSRPEGESRPMHIATSIESLSTESPSSAHMVPSSPRPPQPPAPTTPTPPAMPLPAASSTGLPSSPSGVSPAGPSPAGIPSEVPSDMNINPVPRPRIVRPAATQPPQPPHREP